MLAQTSRVGYDKHEPFKKITYNCYVFLCYVNIVENSNIWLKAY